jgi:glycosyltransferase involved in cell wall biosynthesis
MRIDFLISKMSDGGAQRVISLLANYLDEHGHSIRVITFTKGDHYVLNASVVRIRLHEQPIVKSVVFSGFFSLLKFYRKKENRPDVMSSHIDLLGYMTIPVAKFYGIKIVASEHNNHLSRFTYQEKFLWNVLYPLADAVTILTSFDWNYFKGKNKRVLIMPNPISFKIAPNPLDSTGRKKEIMAIGQLNRYHHKGLDNLLEIAARVIPQCPDWFFTIVGRGEVGRELLEDRVAKLGLASNVSFLGYRSDIQELLGNTGIYILPSRWEGLPMTLLEAMSQGAPCISYDCVSGPADIIQHGVNGSLIENQNQEKMISELLRMIETEALRNLYIKNAGTSLDKFSIENVGKKWEDLFHSLA